MVRVLRIYISMMIGLVEVEESLFLNDLDASSESHFQLKNADSQDAALFIRQPCTFTE